MFPPLMRCRCCTHSLRPAPRYWANYGRKLFEFSFFEDQGVRTQNTAALALAAALKSDIPDNVASEFVWRRQRNFNVSKSSLASFFPSGSTSRVYMCVTLDDSSPFSGPLHFRKRKEWLQRE